MRPQRLVATILIAGFTLAAGSPVRAQSTDGLPPGNQPATLAAVPTAAPAPLPLGRSERLPPVMSGGSELIEQASFLAAANNAAANNNAASQPTQTGVPDDANRFGMLGLAFQEYVDKQKNPTGFPKGKPSLVIGGQVQNDTVYFSQDDDSEASVGDLQDAVDFRRARIVMQGVSHEVYRYVFGVDFALSGRPSFLDVYLEHIDLPFFQNARIGHFFEPFSLERVTQNRNNTFMERSLVDTFAPARNMGVMTNGVTKNERATWQIGTFRTGSNDYGNDSFDSGQSLTLRSTFLPFYDEGNDGRNYMHLGGCYSYRDTYENQVRFRNSPEIRIQEPNQPTNFGPIFVDTGNIPASHFQLFDAEFIWTMGSFSVQSEYACTTVDQTGGPGLFFDAVMVQASYFLTGEYRPYDRKLGINQRVIPHSNFWIVRTEEAGVCSGVGAWELALRFSMIRLNDQNIAGNDLHDFTAGVNWYLNPYARVRFNYIRAFLNDLAVGTSQTDIFGMRLDFEF